MKNNYTHLRQHNSPSSGTQRTSQPSAGSSSTRHPNPMDLSNLLNHDEVSPRINYSGRDNHTPPLILPPQEIPIASLQSSSARQQQIDAASKLKERTCEVCSKIFSHKSHKTIHLKTVHEGERNFKCDKCINKAFGRKCDLNKHIKTVHEGERPFKCKNCNHPFGEKGNLTKHIAKMHPPESNSSQHHSSSGGDSSSLHHRSSHHAGSGSHSRTPR